MNQRSQAERAASGRAFHDGECRASLDRSKLASDVKPAKLDVAGWCRSLASCDGVVFGPISQIGLEVRMSVRRQTALTADRLILRPVSRHDDPSCGQAV